MEFSRAWNPLRAALEDNFSFNQIKKMVGLAGLDLTLPAIANLEQRAEGGASKGQLMTGIDRALSFLDDERKRKFIVIVAEKVIPVLPTAAREEFELHLGNFGLGIAGKAVVPLKIFDVSELAELPVESRDDIVKAAQRLRDGDLSGALSAACGAVDATTSAVYESLGLGDPGKASFQEKCKRALEAKEVFVKLEQELRSLGWEDSEVTKFKNNFEGALNQAAYVMQTLRSRMGDVHGTKPVIKPLVFDSLKWAELIVRALQTE